MIQVIYYIAFLNTTLIKASKRRKRRLKEQLVGLNTTLFRHSTHNKKTPLVLINVPLNPPQIQTKQGVINDSTKA